MTDNERARRMSRTLSTALDLVDAVLDRLISIHALLAESDLCGIPVAPYTADFYPRSPCGERHHARPTANTGATKISIHALLAESDIFRLTWHPG